MTRNWAFAFGLCWGFCCVRGEVIEAKQRLMTDAELDRLLDRTLPPPPPPVLEEEAAPDKIFSTRPAAEMEMGRGSPSFPFRSGSFCDTTFGNVQ